MSDSVRPHPNVVFTLLDNTSGALLHLDSKRYYTLNETAAFLWSRLQSGDDAAAMARALIETFDVTLEVAREAVSELLDELREERLLGD